MLSKIMLAFALAVALSAGRSFAQSNPTLDCTPYYGSSTC